VTSMSCNVMQAIGPAPGSRGNSEVRGLRWPGKQPSRFIGTSARSLTVVEYSLQIVLPE
jgi:hypothetical protein